ncbi:hypothetical protein AVEN_265659-1 [Araneus ventricosus]|uniref:Uncharacterized protein n=1 Tax=Araneus ventricosus TaxID=182803 RepID=A0A4Y2MZD9_ARAVE|nr:hypothetical protein AVEN_265659-1 [Araneus ventricosus]
MKKATAASSTFVKKVLFEVAESRVKAEDSTLNHHFYVSGDNYIAVSDIGDSMSIHHRKFRKNSSEHLFSTKKGVSFSPAALAKEMDNLPLPSKSGKAVIVRDSYLYQLNGYRIHLL